MTSIELPHVSHRFVTIDGVEIFYRDTGPCEGLPLLLLHGFPASSFQFRRLMDALGQRHRLVALDYPGFGHSELPRSTKEGGTFAYTFEHLSELVERFCEHLGLTRFALYVFDFGAPIGLRVALRRPEWIAGLIVQNGNAFDQGLSELARQLIALPPDDPKSEDAVRSILTMPMTRHQYEHGTTRPERIAPDGWTLDQHFLDQPGRHRPQIDLALDYRSNVALYPRFQAWLGQHQPPTLVLWGQNDEFFLEPGARAYLDVVPNADLHLFATGHFALEEMAPEIAPLIAEFMDTLSRDPHRR